MVYKVALSLIFLNTLVFGITQEAKEIKSHYKSLARDFVIYEYVKKKDTPKEDIQELKKEVYRYRGKIKRVFEKRLKSSHVRVDCDKLKGSKYIKQCVKPYLTPKQVQKMSTKRVMKLFNKLSKKDKKNYRWVRAMLAKNTFKALQRGKTSDFLKVFNSVSDKYKHKVLDKWFYKSFAQKLSRTKGFDRFVMHVAMNGRYKNLPKSLVRIKNTKLDFNGAFYLGLMALKQNMPKTAVKFFKIAQKTTKKAHLKDKAIFWQYQAIKSKKTLLQLAYKKGLNFYTFWAKEKLGFKDMNIIEPKPRKKSLKGFDITNPYQWAKLNDKTRRMPKAEFKKYIKQFFTIETLPHYTLLVERFSGYKKNFFITPYKRYLKDVELKRKVLIYALARQESRFVPASVSTSYALGFMQFMPFLVRATAKSEKIDDFKYFDIFEPKNAILFANNHLDFLEKYLHNPLLIAYAYNGGIGFTKRLFTKKKLFEKGRYEPYMSMELVPYRESRKYAKRVFLNYVIYARMLGLRVDTFSMLKSLTNPGKAESFRK